MNNHLKIPENSIGEPHNFGASNRSCQWERMCPKIDRCAGKVFNALLLNNIPGKLNIPLCTEHLTKFRIIMSLLNTSYHVNEFYKLIKTPIADLEKLSMDIKLLPWNEI